MGDLRPAGRRVTSEFPFSTPGGYTFDGDEAVRAAKLRSAAASAGPEHFWPFTLPLTPPDLDEPSLSSLEDEWSTATETLDDDFMQIGTRRAAAPTTATPSTHRPSAWPTGAVSLADLLATVLPPPDYLFESLWRCGEHFVLSAPRAVGKSWAALQIATALATGDDFLGFHVPRRRRVLYISTELTEAALHERFSLLDVPQHARERIHTYARGDLRLRATSIQEQFRTTSSRSGDRNADEQTGYSKRYAVAELEPAGLLEKMIEETGAEVVIIDPWASFFDGNESDNAEVARALEVLSDVGRRFGVSFLNVHHHGKGSGGRHSRDPHDAARGAGRLMDWSSVRMTLSRLAGDGMALDITTRNDPSPGRLYVQMHAGEAQPWRLASPITASQCSTANLDAFTLTVAQHVHDNAGERLSVASLRRALGKNEEAIKAALTRAHREGWIIYVPAPAGGRPRIEPKGDRP
ncbi:MAG: AAA family ATPase [Actinobacteria bacterium]|uniref:Unannotated protein n=1 Tax=freshwater metagenome TaxID=449393 RepID=A0A6J6F6D7_9ZZZZ|nr:AAA family ATPase [Actinomycetota bacterium]